MALLRRLGAGLILGVLTGIVARGFMRLVTVEPEFSWAGTLLIITIFTIAGVALAAAYDVKQRHRSRWWKLLALPSILLGFGQGMFMLPGILAFSLLLSRQRWMRVTGLLLLSAFLAVSKPLIGASDAPFTLRMALGVAVMLGVCAAIATALRAALTGWVPREGQARRVMPRLSEEMAPMTAAIAAPRKTHST
ncbi:hypothetical protein N802_12465 [Knoellia sinensis KCTC 19936]|uniref:Uncharacterized protein n=2 Tax=Knoellia TaxID=136099 RepID=A0A0A0JAD8_9MICO|nr:hypothetical protein N802_12465 [Knoellia sinensis KCTC 19936]